MSRNSPTWKQFEIEMAELIGGHRNPMSGSSGGYGTASDIVHPVYFPECKLVKSLAVKTLWPILRQKAAAEQKIPILLFQYPEIPEPLALLPAPTACSLVKARHGTHLPAPPDPEILQAAADTTEMLLEAGRDFWKAARYAATRFQVGVDTISRELNRRKRETMDH